MREESAHVVTRRSVMTRVDRCGYVSIIEEANVKS